MLGLLGKKLGMTRHFTAEGNSIAVSVILAGPCVVVQKKTMGSDGYDAVQLGFEEIPESKVTRPLKGHFGRLKLKPQRYLREFRVDNPETYQEGQVLTVECLKAGDTIDVTGISKGKGFQGVIKRHGKAGGPASHGSRFHRSTGSIGQRTSPGEVFKNMKLPGHLGAERVTVRKLTVVDVRPEENLLLVKGAVPGASNGLLRILRRESRG